VSLGGFAVQHIRFSAINPCGDLRFQKVARRKDFIQGNRIIGF
jgi:hypothetical protein